MKSALKISMVMVLLLSCMVTGGCRGSNGTQSGTGTKRGASESGVVSEVSDVSAVTEKVVEWGIGDSTEKVISDGVLKSQYNNFFINGDLMKGVASVIKSKNYTLSGRRLKDALSWNFIETESGGNEYLEYSGVALSVVNGRRYMVDNGHKKLYEGITEDSADLVMSVDVVSLLRGIGTYVLRESDEYDGVKYDCETYIMRSTRNIDVSGGTSYKEEDLDRLTSVGVCKAYFSGDRLVAIKVQELRSSDKVTIGYDGVVKDSDIESSYAVEFDTVSGGDVRGVFGILGTYVTEPFNPAAFSGLEDRIEQRYGRSIVRGESEAEYDAVNNSYGDNVIPNIS